MVAPVSGSTTLPNVLSSVLEWLYNVIYTLWPRTPLPGCHYGESSHRAWISPQLCLWQEDQGGRGRLPATGHCLPSNGGKVYGWVAPHCREGNEEAGQRTGKAIAIIWQEETMKHSELQQPPVGAGGGRREALKFLTAMKTISSTWTRETSSNGIFATTNGIVKSRLGWRIFIMVCIKNMIKIMKINIRRGGGGRAHIPIGVAEFYNQLTHFIWCWWCFFTI